jgi:hypothetical protein
MLLYLSIGWIAFAIWYYTQHPKPERWALAVWRSLMLLTVVNLIYDILR